MPKDKQKILISYTHEDIGTAKKLCYDLKRYGIDVWIDYENVLQGQNWKIAIEEIIKHSSCCLALFSSYATTEKGFLQNDLKIVLELLAQHSELDIDLITIRLDNCEPSLKASDIHFIDLFPESEYNNGLKKILFLINPRSFSLRTDPMILSETDVNNTVMQHDFFDKYLNPQGLGFNHQYKELTRKEAKFIVDEKTNLIWQKSGSEKEMTFKKAEEWIIYLNQRAHADFEDWRLPTLEEAMSLMEPDQKNAFLFVDPIFDNKQTWIWTADPAKDDSQAWAVHFLFGRCNVSPLDANLFVRAVRSGTSLN
jgi:hypothetical protein